MFDSLRFHELQHIRFPCPPLSPGACSNSCPLSLWSCLTISSSATLFSFCFLSFPASGSSGLYQHSIFHFWWLYCGYVRKASCSQEIWKYREKYFFVKGHDASSGSEAKTTHTHTRSKRQGEKEGGEEGETEAKHKQFGHRSYGNYTTAGYLKNIEDSIKGVGLRVLRKADGSKANSHSRYHSTDFPPLSQKTIALQ